MKKKLSKHCQYMKTSILLYFACVLVFSSCESFLQGMSQGMTGYGMGGYGMAGYGMGTPLTTGPSPMGGTFIGPIYCPPINTQAIEQAAQIANQRAQMETNEMIKNMEIAKKQIEAQAAYDAQHGIVPVVVDYNSSSSSSTSTSSPNSLSNSNNSHKFEYGNKTCSHCMGSGVCSTCNGTGIQDHMNTVLCGVCYNHNGKCKWCSGRGTNYGLISK